LGILYVWEFAKKKGILKQNLEHYKDKALVFGDKEWEKVPFDSGSHFIIIFNIVFCVEN
jgi:hypothetical protein